MTDTTNEARANATTEGTPDPMLDLFLEHWPRIAATAWDGLTTGGRGVVTVVAGSVPPELGYRFGSPCGCHEALVAGYDPAREAILAVIDDDGDVTWIAALGGSPLPPDAAACVTAAEMDATVH